QSQGKKGAVGPELGDGVGANGGELADHTKVAEVPETRDSILAEGEEGIVARVDTDGADGRRVFEARQQSLAADIPDPEGSVLRGRRDAAAGAIERHVGDAAFVRQRFAAKEREGPHAEHGSQARRRNRAVRESPQEMAEVRE